MENKIFTCSKCTKFMLRATSQDDEEEAVVKLILYLFSVANKIKITSK